MLDHLLLPEIQELIDDRDVRTLLGYPEDSIGRLMTTDYVAVRPSWTVRNALEHIRRYGKDSETLNVIYVSDEEGRLIDDLRIREILLADVDQTIRELMDGRFIALRAQDDQEEAVEVFRDYDRVALPVTDSQGAPKCLLCMGMMISLPAYAQENLSSTPDASNAKLE